ncbi:rhodanese-like domain-containing protein [Enterovibrio nigricans]|uniref:rhodanese-like domain-containing protein n=1 Tax=Enterovibrio nigricans TaxID=504469 RepID=UPI001FCCF5E2|nr:rhodanese-like domain-containing protein [Enterovibrio nigricans]
MRVNCAIFICLCTISINAETVLEPLDYRNNQYRAPVPTTLQGARVIESPEALKAFMTQDNPVLIDVYPAPNRPDNLSQNTLWIEPKRDTIPSSLWLANVGHGIVPDSLVKLLADNLPLNRPVVVFCEPSCWHSWNAGKRALALGAKEVYWYRAGVKGWQEAGYELETHTPVRP